MDTLLEQAKKALEEADAIMSLPPAASAARRISHFRQLRDSLKSTVDFQTGFQQEHRELTVLVSALLDATTRRSPDMSRALRETEGFREARNALIAFIEARKPSCT